MTVVEGTSHDGVYGVAPPKVIPSRVEVRERVRWKENQPFRAFNQNISNIPTLCHFNSLKVDLSLASKIEGHHFSIGL